MPTYEYECKKCKHRFELLQKMSDDPIKECPKCRAEVKKLFSASIGIIVKGSTSACPSSCSKERCQAEGPACNPDSPCAPCGMNLEE